MVCRINKAIKINFSFAFTFPTLKNVIIRFAVREFAVTVAYSICSICYLALAVACVKSNGYTACIVCIIKTVILCILFCTRTRRSNYIYIFMPCESSIQPSSNFVTEAGIYISVRFSQDAKASSKICTSAPSSILTL